ncbi:MAG: hypothetical protein IJH37_05355 [Clostridia bacterium]|nr:hypothetical protein [Clostridia bacterium]
MEVIFGVACIIIAILGLTLSLKQSKKNNKDRAERLAKSFSDNNLETNSAPDCAAECPSCGKHMDLNGNVFICSACGYTVKKDEIKFFKMSIERVNELKQYTIITGTILNGALIINDEIYINGYMYNVQQILPPDRMKPMNQATKGMKIRIVLENVPKDMIPIGEFITKHEN